MYISLIITKQGIKHEHGLFLLISIDITWYKKSLSGYPEDMRSLAHVSQQVLHDEDPSLFNGLGSNYCPMYISPISI